MRRTAPIMTVLAVALAGCMRISRGPLQLVDIQTSPPGASISIRPGPSQATSPASVELSRKPEATVNVSEPGYKGAAYVLTASLPGYQDATVPIESRVSTDTWVRNLIWLHPLLYGLGVMVDMSTGAGYELRPSNVMLVLEPAQ